MKYSAAECLQNSLVRIFSVPLACLAPSSGVRGSRPKAANHRKSDSYDDDPANLQPACFEPLRASESSRFHEVLLHHGLRR